MQDFEKLGVFYLGREYDLDDEEARATDCVLYDSKDLVTHAVCVGMTGSGKTGLCLALLEEAAIDGIPAIVIDPKGDLGNLLLTFPDLAPGGLPPVDQRGRRRARRASSPDDFAAEQAETVEEGPGRVGPGRRADPAAARGRRLRHLHAGQHGGRAGLDPQVVRRAAGRRRARTPSCCASASTTTGDEPARAARHRGRPGARAASTSCSRRSSTRRGSSGQDLDLAALIQHDPEAAGDRASA